MSKLGSRASSAFELRTRRDSIPRALHGKDDVIRKQARRNNMQFHWIISGIIRKITQGGDKHCEAMYLE